MSKRILVTGSNGYIGRHVVKSLRAHGAYVIALDIHASDTLIADEHIIADVFDPEFSVNDYCDTIPDCCLHLAWRNGFEHNNQSHMDDLSSHFRFLSSLSRSGIGQIAVMGSMHEVGYWEGPIDASTPCKPQSLYGIAKNALKDALSIEFEGTDIAFQWLRGFYIYGDDEGSQSIFGKIKRAAKNGQKTFPFTSGKNKYDFLSVDALAEMISSVVMQDEIQGIINLCSGRPISLANAVETFIHDNDLDIVLEYGAFPDRPYDSPGVWGDATIIESIMG